MPLLNCVTAPVPPAVAAAVVVVAAVVAAVVVAAVVVAAVVVAAVVAAVVVAAVVVAAVVVAAVVVAAVVVATVVAAAVVVGADVGGTGVAVSPQAANTSISKVRRATIAALLRFLKTFTSLSSLNKALKISNTNLKSFVTPLCFRKQATSKHLPFLG